MLEGVLIALGRAATGPCIRQTAQPLTTGARQGFPDRFEVARQRLASLMGEGWCMRLIL
jgi:hypothetical protein